MDWHWQYTDQRWLRLATSSTTKKPNLLQPSATSCSFSSYSAFLTSNDWYITFVVTWSNFYWSMIREALSSIWRSSKPSLKHAWRMPWSISPPQLVPPTATSFKRICLDHHAPMIQVGVMNWSSRSKNVVSQSTLISKLRIWMLTRMAFWPPMTGRVSLLDKYFLLVCLMYNSNGLLTWAYGVILLLLSRFWTMCFLVLKSWAEVSGSKW